MPWLKQSHVLGRKHYMEVTAVPDVMFDMFIQIIAALPAIIWQLCILKSAITEQQWKPSLTRLAACLAASNQFNLELLLKACFLMDPLFTLSMSHGTPYN